MMIGWLSSMQVVVFIHNMLFATRCYNIKTIAKNCSSLVPHHDDIHHHHHVSAAVCHLLIPEHFLFTTFCMATNTIPVYLYSSVRLL